ncbi:MAG TPA: ATPase, T2SS/T4P/T4SS family [Anaerohalosphaeraceae bacterium]|jgi:type IV pilus assembly protein PilB|nr:ATPase, T2SS/T4P/T4SS family [Anaerohalosphaeraceae bacterium]HRT49258.1 ATPase, T2SS/T4P/T4SS family [Anaerohalosphaeraceae bacterium]HRT85203.1 ATPase, T2SS/T4P/T4SS family [Anaerohalosphaeraceae bacterium]
MGEIGTEQKLQLGQVLLDRGIVTEEQIQQALERQQQQGHQKLLGELLVDMGYCSENQIASALAHAYGVPYAQVTPKICDPAVVEILPRDFLEEHAVLPLFKVYDALTVAVSEPSNVFLIDEIERLSNCKVQVVCATVKDIHATLQTYMPAANVFVIDDIIDDAALEDFALIESITEDISELEQAAGQSPVVRLVNSLLYNAVRENASDIHIEPDDKRLRVRYRVDGRLYEKMRPPYQMHSAIVSRIKIMAELDIAQRRLPQDGSIHVLMEGRPIDLRVSVMPGNFGEKVVVRVIDAKKILNSLEALGFSYDNLELFREKIKAPNGIVLVTGPTGSGKNTTLYAALAELNGEDVNICTVEDPVECNIPAVNQFEVHEAAGFTFATALRSLLRQDPDIIMVGEIRDRDTANIAVQAALTGHLVLSTLHTNDAPGAVTRLIDLGVPPYLVSASLIAVLAQRLVRKICPNCKEEYEAPHTIRKIVENWMPGIDRYYRGIGCRKCRNTGFLGRIAIHELFVPTEEILDMIAQDATLKSLRTAARNAGMVPLHVDGFEKVRAGITTIDEVLRVSNLTG